MHNKLNSPSNTTTATMYINRAIQMTNERPQRRIGHRHAPRFRRKAPDRGPREL